MLICARAAAASGISSKEASGPSVPSLVLKRARMVCTCTPHPHKVTGQTSVQHQTSHKQTVLCTASRNPTGQLASGGCALQAALDVDAWLRSHKPSPALQAPLQEPLQEHRHQHCAAPQPCPLDRSQSSECSWQPACLAVTALLALEALACIIEQHQARLHTL